MPKGEFTYVEVKCANSFGLFFHVIPRRAGKQGGTEFDRHFKVRFGEGGEEFSRLVLTEGLRRELLTAFAGDWLRSFDKLALVGNSLLYIETGRIKRAEQAERFARMPEALRGAADRVGAAPPASARRPVPAERLPPACGRESA